MTDNTMSTPQSAASTESTSPTTKKKRGGTDKGLATVRVDQSLRLFWSRHEEGLPNDGDGRAVLRALVGLAIHITKERAAKLAEIYRLAPWASSAEERDDLERRALAEKWWPTNKELGDMFKVTAAERHALKAWQLTAIDETPEQLKADKEEKHRDRSRESRRQKRADRAAKPSARDREDRLLEELSHDPAPIKVLVERVRHLPEFKGVKDLSGAVHKAADALKARGLGADEDRRQGRKPERWVRRARESDRHVAAPVITTAAETITVAATPAMVVQQDAAAGYLEGLAVKLQDFTRAEDKIAAWFVGPTERAIRERSRLTPEQLTEARGMVERRLSTLRGRSVTIAWSTPT